MYGTTGRRAYDDHHNSDDSDSSSSDFMAHPFQAFRPSLFVSLQSPEDPTGTNAATTNSGDHNQSASHNDTLPSLQDRSWIGARMSPILNDDDDDQKVNNNIMPVPQQQQQQQQQLDDNYYYSRLQPPSSSSQQQPHFLTQLGVGHGRQAAAQPSAGHQRKEYPPFGIHPLHNQSMMMQQHAKQQQQDAKNNKQWWKRLGSLVCFVSGLFLVCMGVYDAYYIYFDSNNNNKDHTWSLPWGQPSPTTSIAWGGLTPASILLLNDNDSASRWSWIRSYGRLVTSALQSNSVVEWLLLVLGWFVCQRPSVHRITSTTLITVYMVSLLTGQLWMMAVWWMTAQPQEQQQQHAYYNNNSQNNNVNNLLVVAHCAAWGTCGVLCFVGMVRPQRRFGCFMICIGLVLLSLLQATWTTSSPSNTTSSENNNNNEQVLLSGNNPLPLVVGCTASSFVGWAIYGSQMIGVVTTTNNTTAFANNNQHQLDQQLSSLGISTNPAITQQQRQVHSGVRLFCAVMVVMAWIMPLLVLAYFDYYYYYYGEGHAATTYADYTQTTSAATDDNQNDEKTSWWR